MSAYRDHNERCNDLERETREDASRAQKVLLWSVVIAFLLEGLLIALALWAGE